MPYNSRRTPTGRGMPMPQVNYHQQPAGKQASNAQSRNTGYSTQQPAYQTFSPQGYSTSHTGYSYSPAPSQPAVQPKQEPPLPSTPAAPSQPQAPAQPKTPAPKQEPTTPQDTPQMDVSKVNGETTEPKLARDGSKVPFWLTKKRTFVKLSNKMKKARQNAKLRRILNPKNALTLLNELKPGEVKFVVRADAGWGYVASVDIDGKMFSGHASNGNKAKVAASEQAIKHLLTEKLARPSCGEAVFNEKGGVKNIKSMVKMWH